MFFSHSLVTRRPHRQARLYRYMADSYKFLAAYRGGCRNLLSYIAQPGFRITTRLVQHRTYLEDHKYSIFSVCKVIITVDPKAGLGYGEQYWLRLTYTHETIVAMPIEIVMHASPSSGRGYRN